MQLQAVAGLRVQRAGEHFCVQVNTTDNHPSLYVVTFALGSRQFVVNFGIAKNRTVIGFCHSQLPEG